MPSFNNITLSIGGEDVPIAGKLDSLPTGPGVYQFKSDDGKILYVGKAINLRNRVRQYFQKSHRLGPRIELMVSKATGLDIIVTDTEVEALILESTLVKKYSPRYNVSLKDDKSYPYIIVTHEPFPRVFVTRRLVRDGSRYFGPFTDVKMMRSSLKMIRDIFKVRSCNYAIDDDVIRKRKIKVCLDYHIKKCEGPCEGLVSRERYTAMIDQVVQVLKGKTSALVSDLTEQMQTAAEALRFEEAAELRNKIEHLGVYNERQKVLDTAEADRDLFTVAREGDDACGVVFRVREGKVVGKQHYYMSGVEEREEAEVVAYFLRRYYLDAEDIPAEILVQTDIEDHATIEQWLTGKRGESTVITVPKIGAKAKLAAMCRNNAQFLLDELKIQKLKRADYVPYPMKALQKDLRLAVLPRRMECFDISTIQGSDTVASMVIFVDGKPRKSEYRKFKISSVDGPNDFASMREVIERRYRRLLEEQQTPPDLIVIDGGKGQLSSAVEVLKRLGIVRMSITGEPEQESVAVIGLAKRLEEVFLPGESEPRNIPRSSSGLKLLQQIRDEAHRFAVTYHRKVRRKRTLQTELDLVTGIGKKKARDLLEIFGSVQGVRFATTEQLAEVVGEKVALKISEYFEVPEEARREEIM